MVSNDLQGRSRLRRIALPASFLVGLGISAASCAADLADPDAYTVARNQGVGSGGTPTASGGTVGATGGSKAIGGATGTGGATPSGGMTGANPPLPDCANAAFTAHACTAACHNTSNAALFGGGLDLSGDVAVRLKDVMAKNAMATDKAGCGTLLIDSTNNANSVFLKRVKGTGPCGPGMPSTNGVSAAEQQCFADWINKF